MSIAKILIKAWCVLSEVFVITLSSLALCGAWLTLNMIDHAHMPPTGEELFLIFFALGLAIFWTPLAWMAMHYATPKTLVDRYLREPHFTAAEIIGGSVISPLLPVPTTVFMVACTLPRNWLASRWFRRRQMSDLRDHVPRWFVWCSRVIWVGAVVHGMLWISLLIGFLIYDKFFG